MENSRSERGGFGSQVVILKGSINTHTSIGGGTSRFGDMYDWKYMSQKLCEDVPGYFSEHFEEHIQ